MGTIRATDDEQLARRLWGEHCQWDDERRQYVPTEPKSEESADSATSGTSTGRTQRRTSRKAELEERLRTEEHRRAGKAPERES